MGKRYLAIIVFIGCVILYACSDSGNNPLLSVIQQGSVRIAKDISDYPRPGDKAQLHIISAVDLNAHRMIPAMIANKDNVSALAQKILNEGVFQVVIWDIPPISWKIRNFTKDIAGHAFFRKDVDRILFVYTGHGVGGSYSSPLITPSGGGGLESYSLFKYIERQGIKGLFLVDSCNYPLTQWSEWDETGKKLDASVSNLFVQGQLVLAYAAVKGSPSYAVVRGDNKGGVFLNYFLTLMNTGSDWNKICHKAKEEISVDNKSQILWQRGECIVK